MINHEYLELFNQSSIRKDIDIAYDTDSHITNSDVVSGSFNLNESAFATKELRFGSLVSSQLSVKLYNTVPNLMDKQLDVSIVVNNVTSNPLKIGKYKVLEDKPTTDRLYKQIKAYDGLYEVINKNVVEWYENISFPMTLKAFRDSFCSYVGITQVATSLVNDNIQIEKTMTTNSLSGQQVLSAICELNGAIGRMNRDGNFEYVILEVNPSDRITIDKIVSKSGSYEDFDSQPISKVQIRQTTDDIGAIVGENGNTYIVQDNFLVYGKSSADLTTIATNLLSVIEGISYKPFNIKAIYGNPCYEIGDAITVITKNKTFNSYIFNRTLKGIQAMSDTIKADGVEYYTENLNSANVQIQQLKRQTNELSRTVEETKSTITSIETIAESASEVAERANQTATNANSVANNANTVANQANTKADDIAEDLDKNYSTTVEMQSQIKQSADAITSTVSKTYATQESVKATTDNLQQQIDGAIETFTGSVVPTLTNSPASDWTTTAIKDTHIGDLYIVNANGGDYAGFYYRFEKSGSTYQWVLLKDNEVTKALQDAKEANDKAQAVANNLSTNYSTTAQMNSAIEQSANSIKSTVSATYTTKEEFNDLEIGGRNLVVGSATHNFKQYSISPYVGTVTVVDDTDAISKKHIEIKCTTTGTGFYSTPYKCKVGTTYTYSFWAKCSVTKSGSAFGFENGGKMTLNLTTEWQYYEHTFTTSDYKYYAFVNYLNWNANEIFYIRDFKLEEGTKATTWTPAPEDVDSSISAVDTKANTNATNISSLTTRVTNAESSITQTAEEIRSEVSAELETKKDAVYHNITGDATAAPYRLIATITIKAVYTNSPIRIGINQRNKQPSTCYIAFTNANSTDPTLRLFQKSGDSNFYIVKSATSTWQLYVSSSAYDLINVIDYDNPYSTITVAWANTIATTLPTGYTTATQLAGLYGVDSTSGGTSGSSSLATSGALYSTKTNLQSSITQNANQIALKVSKGDVSSQLSVESDQVTISGNRLVVDADNLKISKDGKLSCSSAEITGGTINIDTDNESLDIIKLNYASSSGFMAYTSMNPTGMGLGAISSSGLHAYFTQLQGYGFSAESRDTTTGDVVNDISKQLTMYSDNPDSTLNGILYETSVYPKNDPSNITTRVVYYHLGDTTAEFNVPITASKTIKTTGELQSTSANGLRLVRGNYGFIIRNDGSSTYFLLTASGDQYGSFNSLRPLSISDSTGLVTMSNGLKTNTITNTDRITSNYITLHGGLSLGSGMPYIYTSDGNNINFRYTNSAGSTAYTSIQALSVITALKFIKCGTTVISNMTSGDTSVVLMTLATIQGWYSGATSTNVAVFVSNGDGSANSKHVDGATYMNSKWYATFDSGTTATAIRINWMLVVW